GQASSPQMGTPAPAAAASAFAPPPTRQPSAECVVKPVMTEEDLRVCAAAAKSRPAGAMEVAVPVSAPAAAAAPGLQAPLPPTECVIKPVMTEEDLRACGARR
ncbi:MAG TPA: hypothetical protein VFZ54_10700, partial [Burkholderiales bacterium]